MKRQFLSCLLFVGLMGTPVFASAFRIDLSGMFSTSSTADREANRPIEASREDSDDDEGSVVAPVTPEALASAEMEAGIELHEEFDAFGEYYNDPMIMARVRGIIIGLRYGTRPRLAERTGICIVDREDVVCDNLAHLIRLFPERRQAFIDDIEEALTDFSARLIFDPVNIDALYTWFLHEHGRIDCQANLDGISGQSNIVVGSSVGNLVFSNQASSLDFGNLLCPGSESFDLYGIGDAMQGMVGGSVFDLQYQNEFQSSYQSCLAERDRNRGNPSGQLAEGVEAEDGSDDAHAGCHRGETPTQCSARLAEEKARLEDELKKSERNAEQISRKLEQLKQALDGYIQLHRQNGSNGFIAELVLRTSVLVAQTQSALDAQLQDASELEQGIDNIDEGAVEREGALRAESQDMSTESFVLGALGMAFGFSAGGPMGVVSTALGLLGLINNIPGDSQRDSGMNNTPHGDPMEGLPLHPNDHLYCFNQARSAAWMKVLGKFDYDGCNSNVRTLPDDDSGICYNHVPDGSQSRYASRDVAQLICAELGKVAMGDTERGYVCVHEERVDPGAMFVVDPCNDPHAKCVDEDEVLPPDDGGLDPGSVAGGDEEPESPPLSPED